jgi:hypothetical protein
MVELVLPVAPAPGAPFADAVYAGLAATLLSLLGAWKAGARPRFWLGASAVFLWLSFGPSAGLDAALRWGMPLWSTFRYSEKMLPYAALGLALAASHGAAALPARLVRLAPLIVFADLYLRNEGAVRLASPRLLDAEPAAVAALREVEGPDFARRFRIATYYGARPPPAIADGRLTPDEALMRATAEALAPDLNALHGIATLNNYLPATPKWLLDAVRDPRFFARAGRYGVRWIVAYEDPPGVNPLQRVPLPTGATLLRIEDAPREEPAPGGARNAVRAARGGLALSALAALALLALSMAEKRHRLRSQ